MTESRNEATPGNTDRLEEKKQPWLAFQGLFQLKASSTIHCQLRGTSLRRKSVLSERNEDIVPVHGVLVMIK